METRFTPSMTVKLGTYPDNAALQQAVAANGDILWPGLIEILDKIEIASEPTEVKIAIVTEAELGFPDGADPKVVFDKAFSLGLEELSGEAGLQMRLQQPGYPANYQTNPPADWTTGVPYVDRETIHIAMRPVTSSDHIKYALAVRRIRDKHFLARVPSGWGAGYTWAFGIKQLNHP